MSRVKLVRGAKSVEDLKAYREDKSPCWSGSPQRILLPAVATQ